MLGIPADEVLRISAKTGEGVPELLDAVDRAHPAADGRRRRAAAGADVRLVLRRVPRRRSSSVRVFNGTLTQRRQAALRPGATRPTTPRRSACGCRCRRRSRRSVRARSATSSPGSRTSARRRSVRPSPTAARPRRRARGLPRSEADGVLRALSRRRRRVRRPARGAGAAAAQRLVVHLRARDVGRARLRVPLRVPRAAAHGDRARAARARVRPVARRDRAERRVPRRSSTDGSVEVVDNPSAMPAAERGRGDRGAVRQRHDPHADRVRRHAHGARAADGAARCRRWSTSRRSASSSCTRCRSARSSSTSSTS